MHHGNGTQWLTYDDPSILPSRCTSTELPARLRLREENGEGAGLGANVNVPLPAGSGVGAYVAAFERVVIPALRRFQPELIIVASGLDASAYDPLARQMMTSRRLPRPAGRSWRVADEVCDGRSSSATRAATRRCTSRSAAWPSSRRMVGVRTIPDPYLRMATGLGGQELQPHQDAMIAQSEALVANVPAP